jgi:hypothetical protein
VVWGAPRPPLLDGRGAGADVSVRPGKRWSRRRRRRTSRSATRAHRTPRRSAGRAEPTGRPLPAAGPSGRPRAARSVVPRRWVPASPPAVPGRRHRGGHRRWHRGRRGGRWGGLAAATEQQERDECSDHHPCPDGDREDREAATLLGDGFLGRDHRRLLGRGRGLGLERGLLRRLGPVLLGLLVRRRPVEDEVELVHGLGVVAGEVAGDRGAVQLVDRAEFVDDAVAGHHLGHERRRAQEVEGLRLAHDAEAVDADDLAVGVDGRPPAHTGRHGGADLVDGEQPALAGLLRADLAVLVGGLVARVGHPVARRRVADGEDRGTDVDVRVAGQQHRGQVGLLDFQQRDVALGDGLVLDHASGPGLPGLPSRSRQHAAALEHLGDVEHLDLALLETPSWTFCAMPSDSIVVQNGQAVEMRSGSSSSASSMRSMLTRLPMSSSIHMRAPPAPQQKPLDRQRASRSAEARDGVDDLARGRSRPRCGGRGSTGRGR